ncbi:MAG: ferredoxin [Parasphingorhabdus sp.]
MYIAPEVFSQDDDDGIVVLLTELPDPGLIEAVADAVRQCPSMAIQIE